jgi:small subunit ribosomal protein S5
MMTYKNTATELKAAQEDALQEKLVCVRRHSRTVKGGRIMSFSALVVVGDGGHKVGYARGRALSVPAAVSKATAKARRTMIEIEIKNDTILYPILAKAGATQVYLQPATPGTGLVASHAVRSVLETIGMKNVLSKIYGSTNPMNVVRATFNGLKQMKSTRYFSRKRGLTYTEMFTHVTPNDIEVLA